MTEEIRKQVADARIAVEQEMGFAVPDEFAEEIFELCKRKCVCAGEDEDYLPIMYRYELPMKVAAYAISEVSQKMHKMIKEVDEYVRNLPSVAMPSAVP